MNRTAAMIAKNVGEIPEAGELEEIDRALLEQIEAGFETVGSLIAAHRQRAAIAEAMRQGVVGFADDFVAIASDWGFDPTAAVAPVVLAYGSHDVNVPAGHGRWLAEHVPHREVRVNEDAGHMMSPESGIALLAEIAAEPLG